MVLAAISEGEEGKILNERRGQREGERQYTKKMWK